MTIENLNKKETILTLRLDLDEVEAIVKLLGTVRFDVVEPTIRKVREQVTPQLQKYMAESEAKETEDQVKSLSKELDIEIQETGEDQ